VSVSKETLHYLELYTNNLQFMKTMVKMKGIGDEPIFAVSSIKSKTRGNTDGQDGAAKPYDGFLKNDARETMVLNKQIGNS
jgi:hypothetical protein